MIAIIKYNAGNIGSVKNALNRLGYECVITDKGDEINNAEKVIFPGVGHAASAMSFLREKKLDKVILNLKQPILGICLGQQLLCKYSEEGNVEGLGIFNCKVKKFPSLDIIPHIGWNNLKLKKESFLLQNISENDDVYFVHNYYCEICEDTIATCDYIVPFSAVMQKDNFFATQFHPEKSGEVGDRILKNFLQL